MTKFRLSLLYSFPIVLFFSYYPIFPLGASDSMNFELSLPLLWLFLFSLLSLKDFYLHLQKLYRTKKLLLLPYLAPLYLSLSVLWSANRLRGILTAGILWCLVISCVVIFVKLKQETNKPLFQRIFLYSSASICLVCWLQCFLDVKGVSREVTLLCPGCVSAMFGFPHPSGFAIEPQFMGNLLLAPCFYAIYLFSKVQTKTSKDAHEPSHLPLVFVFLSALFLTFSRGAIYSFAVGYALLLVLNLFRLKNSSFLKTLPILIFSFLFTLLAQGIFAAASPTNDTFLSGIQKSLSQLSLGKIELKSPEVNDLSADEIPETFAPEEDSGESVFDGYVEESTNVRLGLSRSAFDVAISSPKNLLFGTGLGSAGEALFGAGKTSSKKEIVQNEYVSLLLETGFFGFIGVLFVLVFLLAKIKRLYQKPEAFLLGSLILALLLSLLFFSGLPNALHLYLFPVLIAILLPLRSEHESIVD